MEASRPTPPPPKPDPGAEDERGEGRSIYIAIAIVAALTGVFFAAVGIDHATTPICEAPLEDRTVTVAVECKDMSQSNKVVKVIVAAATALASLLLLVAAIGSARVRAGSPLLRPLALAILVAGLVTLAL